VMSHMPRATEIAFRMNYPVYACVYLAIAEALDDVLVTADLAFIEQARAAGLGDRVKGANVYELVD
jgi:predicted nucleic acid-binding protein